MSVLGPKWTMIVYSIPMALGFTSYVLANVVDTTVLIYTGNVLTGTVQCNYQIICLY